MASYSCTMQRWEWLLQAAPDHTCGCAVRHEQLDESSVSLLRSPVKWSSTSAIQCAGVGAFSDEQFGCHGLASYSRSVQRRVPLERSLVYRRAFGQ